MSINQFQPIDVFAVSGSDHLDFFNNQIISEFDPESSAMHYTAICNPKGRVIFTLLMQHHNNQTWVAVDSSLGDNFLQYVNMRRFRLDLAIEKTTIQLSIDASGKSPDLASFQFNTSATTAPDFEPFWAHFFGLNLPWITAASSEQHIPQHLNMDQSETISFTKGCYPGQEIVARLHYLGQVKKRLQVIEYQANQPATNGTKVETPNHSKPVELCSESLPQGAGIWRAQGMAPAPSPPLEPTS